MIRSMLGAALGAVSLSVASAQTVRYVDATAPVHGAGRRAALALEVGRQVLAEVFPRSQSPVSREPEDPLDHGLERVDVVMAELAEASRVVVRRLLLPSEEVRQ